MVALDARGAGVVTEIEWEKVPRTPGKLSPVAGTAYRLSVGPGATDNQMEGLGRLEGLILRHRPELWGATDPWLARLAGLTALQELDLKGRKVTGAGLATPQEVLPECPVYRP
jgi:hypothetical protein